LLNYANLSSRIVYNWADIYRQQLQSGKVMSIWLLAETLIKGDSATFMAIKFRPKGRTLNDRCGIWLLKIDKFSAQSIETEQQR